MKSPTSENEAVLRSLVQPGSEQHLRQNTMPNSRTLEIGCGPGQYRLAINGIYVGVDISSSDYREGLPRTPDVVADAACLPFKDGMFDVVFYSNTFYHFDDAKGALHEAIRVLVPGGHLLLFEYSRKTLERLKAVYGRLYAHITAHVRSCSQWVELLKECGLVHIQLSLNSPRRSRQLLSSVLPRSILHPLIDRREGSVFLVGRKPGLPC